MSLILGIFTFVLVLVSLFMVLVILAQRAKSDGGVGAALGGGMAEAAFGGESGNVLSRATTFATVAFFVLSFGLYLGHIYQHRQALAERPLPLPDAPAMLPTPAGEDSLPDVLGTPPATGTEPAPGATAETPQAPGVERPPVERQAPADQPAAETPAPPPADSNP